MICVINSPKKLTKQFQVCIRGLIKKNVLKLAYLAFNIKFFQVEGHWNCKYIWGQVL